MKIYTVSLLNNSYNRPHKRVEAKPFAAPGIKAENVAANGFEKEAENFKPLNYALLGSILPFCAKKKVSADDVKREAREICKHCHYGKADILENPGRLKMRREDGKIFLDGYYTEKDDGVMTGVCEELAHKVGTILGERFKDDYTPIVISVSGTKYNFGEHVCVVLIKRGEKNDAQLENIRKLKYDQNLNDIEDYDGETLFNGAIFIDPSFGIVCDIEKMPPSYEAIVFFNTLERNNPYLGSKEILLGHNNYLGYLKDVCPQLQAINFPKDAMVAFAIPKDKPGKFFARKKPVFRIFLPFNKQYIEGRVKDLKKTLPNSKFTAFMIKLEEELEESESEKK